MLDQFALKEGFVLVLLYLFWTVDMLLFVSLLLAGPNVKMIPAELE